MPNFEGKTTGQQNIKTSRLEFEKKTLMGALEDKAKEDDDERSGGLEKLKLEKDTAPHSRDEYPEEYEFDEPREEN